MLDLEAVGLGGFVVLEPAGLENDHPPPVPVEPARQRQTSRTTADHADLGVERVVSGDVLGARRSVMRYTLKRNSITSPSGTVVLALDAELADFLGLGPGAELEQLVPAG